MVRKLVLLAVVCVAVAAWAPGAGADYTRESTGSPAYLESSAGTEFVPEGNWSGTDWQLSQPMETGAVPQTVSEEAWMREYGAD